MTNPTPDAALLTDAKRWMGKLPRDQFDMLLALVLDARKSEHAIGFRAGQSHADAGLLAALKSAASALGCYACHAGKDKPCNRSIDQCQTECGNEAGDALVIVDAAIAAAKGTGK